MTLVVYSNNAKVQSVHVGTERVKQVVSHVERDAALQIVEARHAAVLLSDHLRCYYGLLASFQLCARRYGFPPRQGSQTIGKSSPMAPAPVAPIVVDNIFGGRDFPFSSLFLLSPFSLFLSSLFSFLGCMSVRF